MAGIDLKINLGGDYVDSDIAVEHGDFEIRGGKLLMVAGDDLARQVGQRLHIRGLLHRGEVFFNTAAGFPYAAISKFKQSSGIFDMYMKSYLISTDGVDKMESYSSQLDKETRVQRVRFEVLLANGERYTNSQEIEV